MSTNNKLVAIAVGFAVLAAPLFGAADAKPKIKTHHRHHVSELRGCPVHQIADGSLVDCHGWRKWSGVIGWDNTCFNLDYMPSQFACSSKSSRD
jgi:hypothetical protein